MQLNMNNMPARIITRRMNQHGFTLLEVLIALLVLSIGLLGLAALQTTALRSNTMATTRTHATQLAYDISDRMRANVAGSYTTNADNAVTATVDNYGVAACPNPLPSPLPAPPSSPDPSAMAVYDIDTWCDAVKRILPKGEAKIAQAIDPGIDGILDSPAGALDDVVSYDVTVYWDEARTGATKTDCTVDANGKVSYPSNEKSLRCMRLNVTIPRPIPNA
jgi:type IV pilus assembly protein PilV